MFAKQRENAPHLARGACYRFDIKGAKRSREKRAACAASPHFRFTGLLVSGFTGQRCYLNSASSSSHGTASTIGGGAWVTVMIGAGEDGAR